MKSDNLCLQVAVITSWNCQILMQRYFSVADAEVPHRIQRAKSGNCLGICFIVKETKIRFTKRHICKFKMKWDFRSLGFQSCLKNTICSFFCLKTFIKTFPQLFIMSFKTQFKWDHSFKEKGQSKSFISCRWLQLSNSNPYPAIFKIHKWLMESQQG